jgi:DNA replication protein DnaC
MRELTKEDLLRARIPQLYWDVLLKNIPDTMAYKPRIRKYLQDLTTFVHDGVGLYLWAEENSTGKTAIATIIGKYAMRMGFTFLFMPSFEIVDAKVGREHFEDGITLWERLHVVDILVIDDADKEYKDAKGFSDTTIENVLRARSQRKKVCILTSNLQPKAIKTTYSRSLSELLKEATISVEIYGVSKGGMNWRSVKEKELRDRI